MRPGRSKPFPWDEAMAFGLGRLRLSPAEFWSMTPRELAAAMSAYGAPVFAPGRDELTRLMDRFPDGTKGSD
ncbi:MAG: rcc01693 family protein [Rhizobiaceae bacterium]